MAARTMRRGHSLRAPFLAGTAATAGLWMAQRPVPELRGAGPTGLSARRPPLRTGQREPGRPSRRDRTVARNRHRQYWGGGPAQADVADPRVAGQRLPGVAPGGAARIR